MSLLENLRGLPSKTPAENTNGTDSTNWRVIFLSFDPQNPPIIKITYFDEYNHTEIERYFAIVPQTGTIEQLKHNFGEICKRPECFFFTATRIIDRNISAGEPVCLKSLLDGRIKVGTNNTEATIKHVRSSPKST